MPSPFLAYSITILQKVNFEPSLFRKEYRKALSLLSPDEQNTLRNRLRNPGSIL